MSDYGLERARMEAILDEPDMEELLAAQQAGETLEQVRYRVLLARTLQRFHEGSGRIRGHRDVDLLKGRRLK